MVRQGRGGREEEIMGSRCQDCGNQSKKECVYMRCRTCCKSKGFHCQTHFKSTWVPVYRRRHAHHQQLPSTDPQHPTHLHQGHNYNPRRTAAGHVIINPSSSGQNQHVNNFPAEVNSMANFRCVRVRSMEDTVNQQAYQTSMVIGGHVFKGILYDQGPDYTTATGQSSSSQHVMNKQTSNFINAAASASNITASTSSAAADQEVPHHHQLPSSYPLIPFNAFMPGTQFFL
ncbi:protein SHI RELATED SEQUENCE 3 [Pyrus ussuriensis x Pyrus communis]|uniref:Protein SHI RELATED SEQUENCE 3 n=1 Tax=Pyrus ussuriensis x Pyrus communis TaxID=2448454 RepID=A0A5N5FJ85_9ROSA|nr:protein SHI RELATED SEQUENCE 3 [Pyrus x bretschneideri]KAB2603208.1 protein SHI RELATED SEQUENCE 3 [Pyrus ussuriensis x Pyrus communis]